MARLLAEGNRSNNMALQNHPSQAIQYFRWRLGGDTLRYLIYGSAFGFLFPIIATLIRIQSSGLPLNGTSIVTVQKTDILMWIIDLAPIFLGLFASFAGRRQD